MVGTTSAVTGRRGSTAGQTIRRRAVALPPDERRAAIVAAALPLVIEHGVAVTTRQVAEAAGIAEGTIFGVFVDKQELLDTVVEAALDPAPELVALEAIDLTLPIEARLAAVVAVLQRRVARVWQAMTALGGPRPADRGHLASRVDPPEVAAIATVLAADTDQLRRTPLDTARLVRSITFATAHPALTLGPPATPEEVVSLVLDGLRARDGAPIQDLPEPTESTPC